MGAAAGLEVDAGDVEKPHPPEAGRRLDRHGSHQLGVRVELMVGDPARRHRVIGGDQRMELRRDLLLVQHHVARIEIQARTLVAHLTAGHAGRHRRAEQMEAGVHPHQTVTACPVDFGRHGFADRRQRLARHRNVQDLAGRDAFARIGYANHAAARAPKLPGVAWLAAAHRIKHRAVETNSGAIHGGHGRGAELEITVLAEQFLGHARFLSATSGSASTAI